MVKIKLDGTTIQYTKNGKTTKLPPCRSEALASAYAAAIQACDDNPEMSAGDFLDLYLNSHCELRLQSDCFERYKKTIALHIRPYLNKQGMQDLGENDYRKWLEELIPRMPYPSSVGPIYAILRAAVRRAVAWGLLPVDPLKNLDILQIGSRRPKSIPDPSY